MKATKFCEFFEFHIQPATEPDEYGNMYKYEVVDSQGIFDTRYVNEVKELPDCFDSLYDDYIFELFEEDGLEFSESENKFQQIISAMENNDRYYNSHIKEIVNCILDGNLIEDDVEEVSDEI